MNDAKCNYLNIAQENIGSSAGDVCLRTGQYTEFGYKQQQTDYRKQLKQNRLSEDDRLRLDEDLLQELAKTPAEAETVRREAMTTLAAKLPRLSVFGKKTALHQSVEEKSLVLSQLELTPKIKALLGEALVAKVELIQVYERKLDKAVAKLMEGKKIFSENDYAILQGQCVHEILTYGTPCDVYLLQVVFFCS